MLEGRAFRTMKNVSSRDIKGHLDDMKRIKRETEYIGVYVYQMGNENLKIKTSVFQFTLISLMSYVFTFYLVGLLTFHVFTYLFTYCSCGYLLVTYFVRTFEKTVN